MIRDFGQSKHGSSGGPGSHFAFWLHPNPFTAPTNGNLGSIREAACLSVSGLASTEMVGGPAGAMSYSYPKLLVLPWKEKQKEKEKRKAEKKRKSQNEDKLYKLSQFAGEISVVGVK